MTKPTNTPNLQAISSFHQLLDDRLEEWRGEQSNALARSNGQSWAGMGTPLLFERSTGGQERIAEAFTEELRRHPVNQWLQRQGPYRQALEIYHRGRTPEASPSEVAFREAGFINILVGSLQLAVHTAELNWKPRSISIDNRRKAGALADQLLAYIKRGLYLEDFMENDRLKDLLARYSREMAAPRKREYSGGDARERSIMFSLLYSLIGHDGLSRANAIEIGVQCAGLFNFKDRSSPALLRWVQHRAREAKAEKSSNLKRFGLNERRPDATKKRRRAGSNTRVAKSTATRK